MYCVAQWTQLVIITSILEKYYGVSTLAVYWTSMIYMVIIKMMMKMLKKMVTLHSKLIILRCTLNNNE